MKLIWATRGKSWGFRFILSGGYPDPLVEYDKVFSGFEYEPSLCRRVGDKVALRFPDPEGRTDAAGRVIPHDFVVFPPLADQIHSVEDGIELVWKLPEVSEMFESLWRERKPPSARG